MDNNLRRMIILDHYQNPKHKGLIDDDSYVKVNMNNESCIDEVNVMLHVKDGIIDDVLFDGEACAICTSSSSIFFLASFILIIFFSIFIFLQGFINSPPR